MSGRLPICLAIYLTAKGHYGSRTLYRATLEHLDKQIPLTSFATRVASIKVQEGEDEAAEAIAGDLRARGFRVLLPRGQWARGASHFAECLKDQRAVSLLPEVNDCAYVWHNDDDGIILSHKDPLDHVLARMTRLLSGSADTVTARFLRQEDLPATMVILTQPTEPEGQLLWTKDCNWQSPLLRSLDYHHMARVIEANWSTAIQMHGEALWREVLGSFSRGPRQHAVWHPDYAESVHLGVPTYASVCAQYGLTAAPNPTFP